MLHISHLKMKNFKSFKALNVNIPPSFICFAGPNGAGKCVDGDTEILLADGSHARIRDLVEEAIILGNSEKIDDGHVASYESAKSILSLDTRTLRVTRKRISAFIKRKAPKTLLRVTTRSGREITATEYHPFFILKENEIRSLRADELKTGLRIAIPRKINIQPETQILFELLDCITCSDGIYVPFSKKFVDLLKIKKGSKEWKTVSEESGVPLSAIRGLISKQSILFPFAVRILRYCGLGNLEAIQLITHIKGKGSGRNSIYRIPWENSNELCRFLGYLLAEGSISTANNQLRLTNGSDEIVSDYIELSKTLFGAVPFAKKYKKNAYEVVVNSSPLAKLLSKMGMSFDGAGEKSIPNIILQHASDENLAHLLGGIYAGDGYVSKRSVEITLKSRKLINAMQEILLRFGIVGRVAKVKKRETKTGYVGTYFKLGIFSAEDIRAFHDKIPVVHKQKSERLKSIICRESNPNVDLIEANYLVKKAANELGVSIKKTKKAFPRLDAYCYNQCLPSRTGLNILIKEVFQPLAVQKQIESPALFALDILSSSDIFWDEITEIEKIMPKEDWVYDLTVDQHHNFIANGIFVHNSNVLDAIRFVLGETSLKSLRARKVKDLIHVGSKATEVTLALDGDDKYEIKRVINSDGKVVYRLNGKRTTRTSILEALKKYNLDSSGRNIIAQGEVQRIVNMSGKERRGIIDAVAGISDFEEKKKEAVRDLDIVETRIKEANIVLGERRAFLEELGKERETAIKYSEKRDLLNNSKGTLLKLELDRYDKESSSFDDVEKKLNAEKAEIDKEYDAIQKEISETDAKRMELSGELQAKEKTNEAIRKMEELKASINSGQQLVKERGESIVKLGEEQKELKKSVSEKTREAEEIEKEIEKFKKELKVLESKAVKEKLDTKADGLEPLRKKVSDAEEKLQQMRERLISLQSEINSKQELLASKKEDLESLESQNKDIGEGRDFPEELKKLIAERDGIDDEIEHSFKRTKDINGEIAELDKRLLELKEKASIYKVRSSPQLMNPALRFIEDLKKKESGIYGTVADLIDYDSKFSQAIEAAGGARLLYVVVDSSYTAVDIIEKLKKAKVGRATFIPLDVIKYSDPVKAGGFSSILDKIKYKREVAKAMEYVFADTLFIDGSGDARKVGIGNYRMVTPSGEIFDRSGVISGGRTQSRILSGNEAKKIDDALAGAKSEKDSLINELYSLREMESDLRAKRSKLDINIRTIEMEKKSLDERENEIKMLVEKRKNLQNAVKELDSAISKAGSETEKLNSDIRTSKDNLEELRAKLKEEESKMREEADAQNRMQLDLASELSSLKATVEGKTNELKIRKENIRSDEKRAKEIVKEIEHTNKEIEKAKHARTKESEQLGLLEKKVSETGKRIEKIFENIKLHELKLQELGEKREKKRIELDRIARDINQLDVKKATVTTKLEDIRAEYEHYKETDFLEGISKTKLQENINECERELAELGNVNMAAIDMYDKKKAEIEEVTEKIERLSEERKAILKMIDEIEERKKEAFFDAFYAVSENFKKMFEHVDVGEGYLSLDKPNEPFESGMHIKIKKGGHDHSLDSLSGGETTLVALMFIFALQFYKPSPFYILDEVDAALDKPNSKNLAQLIKGMSENSQFMLVSHNDTVISLADVVFGVTKTDRVSKVVGIKLKEMVAA